LTYHNPWSDSIYTNHTKTSPNLKFVNRRRPGLGPNTGALAGWPHPPAVGARKIFENSDVKSCVLVASALIFRQSTPYDWPISIHRVRVVYVQESHTKS